MREGFVKELFYNAVGTVYVVGLLHLAADVGGEGNEQTAVLNMRQDQEEDW